MRRKNIFFISLNLIIILMMSACGSNQTNEIMVAENKLDIAVQYKRELECLKFDIEHIDINIDDDFYQSYVKRIEFNPQIVTRQFL